MKTLDDMNSLDDTHYFENYEKVDCFAEGEEAAAQFFKNFGLEGEVKIYGPKEFEENGTVTHVFECYVDSGSVDYFYFSCTI